MGSSKSSSQREVYSNTILPQEIHGLENLTLHLKQLEKEEEQQQQQQKNKISRRKEILKFQAEINGKKMEETIVKINKTKSFVL